jgi:hypothetical protein
MKPILLLAVITLAVTSIAAPKQKFINEMGWSWHVEPDDASWALTSRQGMVMRLDELKDDKLLLTFARARTAESEREIVRFRPVAFDSAGQRFEFEPASSGSVTGVAMNGYELDLKSCPAMRSNFSGSKSSHRKSSETSWRRRRCAN